MGLHDGTTRWTECGPSEGSPRMVTVPAPEVPGTLLAQLPTLTNESAAASTWAGAIVRSFGERSPDGILHPTRSGAFTGGLFPPLWSPKWLLPLLALASG